MEETTLQQIILKFDQRTVNLLTDEVRRKRAAGTANAFSDVFLIRLTEALNNKLATQVFKVKENKQPVIREFSK